MSKLDVIITYNRLFRNMAYASCSTLKNENIFVHLNYVEISTKNNSGFQSSSWYECLRKKICFAENMFRDFQENDVLCVADADIYYIQPDKIYDLKSYMQNSNIEFIGGTENLSDYPTKKNQGKLNCGFFLIKKTNNTKSFFSDVLNYNFSDYDFGEQDIINNLVVKNKINSEILSPIDFPMGCYIDWSTSQKKTPVYFMHSTCTANLKEKEKQIDDLINYYNLPKVKWFRTPLTKKEYALYIDGKLQYDTRQ